MSGSRSPGDPVSQFSASLKARMIKEGVGISALSEATAIPTSRLQEIIDDPGTVRLAEIETIARYFGTSLNNLFG